MQLGTGQPAGSAPIIVGGCHRSGTSLVRRILNAHSAINCGPEVKLLLELDGSVPAGPAAHLRFIPSARSLVAEADLVNVLLRALGELHARAAARAGKPRWADKNPENVIHLREWSRVLERDWTFVHVVRNPLDTLASMKQADMPHALPARLNDRIDRYLSWTTAGLRFCQAEPDLSHRVMYEELVTSPLEQVNQLMRALGADFEAGQLSFNQTAHRAGLEDPKVRQTDRIHDNSVGAWRSVLSDEEERMIRRETEALWSVFDPDARWV